MCRCEGGCWYGTSRCYIGLLNIVSLLAGFVLLGMSIYLIKYFDGYEDPILVGLGVWGPLAISIAMIVIGIFGVVGICCLRKLNGCAKCSLSFYLVLSVVLWAAVLVVSSIMFVYASTAQQVADDPPYDFDGAAEDLNTWQLAVWNKCCFESNYSTIEVSLCGDDPVNGVYPGCENQLDTGDLCSCYTDQEGYDNIASKISNEGCSVWEDIRFKGNQWVGDNTTSGCGGGEPRPFQQDFATYVHDYVFPVGFSILGLALVMLVASTYTSIYN